VHGAEGDIVVTSGVEESRYPANIPVGRISRVTDDSAGAKKDLDVEVLVSLNDVDFVTVIKQVRD